MTTPVRCGGVINDGEGTGGRRVTVGTSFGLLEPGTKAPLAQPAGFNACHQQGVGGWEEMDWERCAPIVERKTKGPVGEGGSETLKRKEVTASRGHAL